MDDEEIDPDRIYFASSNSVFFYFALHWVQITDLKLAMRHWQAHANDGRCRSDRDDDQPQRRPLRAAASH